MIDLNKLQSEPVNFYGVTITDEQMKSKGINSMQLISEGFNPRLSVKEDKHETIIDGKDNIINYLKNTF